jgi:hypothetical protein
MFSARSWLLGTARVKGRDTVRMTCMLLAPSASSVERQSDAQPHHVVLNFQDERLIIFTICIVVLKQNADI